MFSLAGEDEQVRKLLLHAPLAVDAPKWTDPHTKVNALLQSHFSRAAIPSGDLAADQRTVLQQTTRLLQVCSAVVLKACGLYKGSLLRPWAVWNGISTPAASATLSRARDG